MSATYKQKVKCGEIEEKPIHLQRLDAVKALNTKISNLENELKEVHEKINSYERIFDELNSLKNEQENMKSSLSKDLEEVKMKVEQNQDEMIEQIESYLVSDNFTPRNNMSEVNERLSSLEEKINNLNKPRIHGIREANDTETQPKAVFSKLKLKKDY